MGANSFNPYAISRAVKFMGFEPGSALSRIHVARAFTEYQMDAIIMTYVKQLPDGHSRLCAVFIPVQSFFHGGR